MSAGEMVDILLRGRFGTPERILMPISGSVGLVHIEGHNPGLVGSVVTGNRLLLR